MQYFDLTERGSSAAVSIRNSLTLMAASVASSTFFPVPASTAKNALGRSKDNNLDMSGVAANVGAVRSSARVRACRCPQGDQRRQGCGD